MRKLRGAYILEAQSLHLIYGSEERRRIENHVELVAPPQTRDSIVENLDLLQHVDVIFSGWGAPLLDRSFIDAAPKLKAFFYGAGTVQYCLTDAVWDRGIIVTTAVEANSVPVAEYTLASILFSLKSGWRLAHETRTQRRFVDRNVAPGCFQRNVGLVSLGTIARHLLKLLRPFELKVIAYDPYVTQAEAEQLGVELVSLEELCVKSDVVSLHSPLNPETEGLITGRHLSSMKPGATFINTARGKIVREDELIEVAFARPDIQFILDVTYPEPPEPDSPLYTLTNVVLTPHIAGSTGAECRRMGQYMVEELERYVAGKSLQWAIAPMSGQYGLRQPVVTYLNRNIGTPRKQAIPVSND